MKYRFIFKKCHICVVTEVAIRMSLFKSLYISDSVTYSDIRQIQDQHKNMAMYRTLIGCAVMLMMSTIVPTLYVSVIKQYMYFPQTEN